MKKAKEGFTVIALTVDPSQFTYIRDCTDGVAAWKALKDAYEKNSRATRISLKRQFYGFEHDTNSGMQSYINGITELAGKLKAIGVKLSDEEITDVLIFNLDKEYSSIAASLTATKDELKIADITGALLEEEQRNGGPPVSGTEVALMGRRGPNRDRREGIKDDRKCYLCERKGHIVKNCKAVKDVWGNQITRQMKAEAISKIKEEMEKSTYAQEICESLNDISY